MGREYSIQIPIFYASSEAKELRVGGGFALASGETMSINSFVIDGDEAIAALDMKSKRRVSLKSSLNGTSIQNVWATVIPPDFSVELDGEFETPDLTPYSVDLEYDSATNLYRGWNLFSLPIDMSIDSQDLEIYFANYRSLWSYSGSNWRAVSSSSELNSKIDSSSSSISRLDSLDSSKGAWINLEDNITLKMQGVAYSIESNQEISTLASGWHLLESGSSPISPKDILALNSQIQSVWAYRYGVWSAYSAIDSMNDTIKSATNIGYLESILGGSGFLVYIK